MADVIYKKGQSSNLNNVQIKEGQILVTEDTGEMYIDVTDNNRKKINAIADQTYTPTSTNAQSGKAVAEAINSKQDTLISGTNIKTINGNSILGNGNISIEGGSGGSIIVDQTFNNISENPQSGKAVAEALNTAATIIPGEGSNSIKQNYYGNNSYGEGSVSIGPNVKTYGANSVGIGCKLNVRNESDNNVNIDGNNSINIGYLSNVYNQDGFSIGRDNKNYSHVGITAGYNNIAGLPEYANKQWGGDIARGAIAMGWENHATHKYSCVLGNHNNSSGDLQTVFGQFCADDIDALFIMGNGTRDSDRSNLYTIDKYGNACFTGDVYVGSSTKNSANSKRLATEEYIDKKIEVSDTAPIEEENKIWLKPITITDSSEYIIEEGTNGIWTYRMWNSGISECWGKQSISVTTSTSNNGYYTGSVNNLQYPSNLFISAPVLNCTLKASSFPGHLFIDGTESSSYTGTISIAAHSNTTVNGYIHLNAKGRWK